MYLYVVFCHSSADSVSQHWEMYGSGCHSVLFHFICFDPHICKIRVRPTSGDKMHRDHLLTVLIHGSNSVASALFIPHSQISVFCLPAYYNFTVESGKVKTLGEPRKSALGTLDLWIYVMDFLIISNVFSLPLSIRQMGRVDPWPQWAF